MPVQESVTDGLPDLPSQSIYSPTKRLKRGLLRLAGRWSRRHYDVEVVIQQGSPCYKKITFKTAHEAQRTRQALTRFGDSRHLPRCHRQDDNTIWADFVRGAPCQRIHDDMMPELARCFAYIAGHQSRLVDFAETGYGCARSRRRYVSASTIVTRSGPTCCSAGTRALSVLSTSRTGTPIRWSAKGWPRRRIAG